MLSFSFFGQELMFGWEFILSFANDRHHCSSYFLLLLMGKLRPGCMIIWVPELTMMPQVTGVLQCFTVLMEAGMIMNFKIGILVTSCITLSYIGSPKKLFFS